MKANKYEYIWVVQTHTGPQYGWEDVTASENKKEAFDDLNSYRENEPTQAHRIIHRRVLILIHKD